MCFDKHLFIFKTTVGQIVMFKKKNISTLPDGDGLQNTCRCIHTLRTVLTRVHSTIELMTRLRFFCAFFDSLKIAKLSMVTWWRAAELLTLAQWSLGRRFRRLAVRSFQVSPGRRYSLRVQGIQLKCKHTPEYKYTTTKATSMSISQQYHRAKANTIPRSLQTLTERHYAY